MNKNERRAAVILAALFILLGIFIACVSAYLYYKSSYLNNLHEELRARNLMLREANNRNEREGILDALSDLKDFNNLLQPLNLNADFQDEIHKIVFSNDAEIVSSQIDNNSQDNNNFIVNLDLNIKGRYANIINALAEWRALPFPVRISEFNLNKIDGLTYELSVKLQALIK